MKKLSIVVLMIAVLSSCNNYLDINETNPNVPTDVDAALILPQAQVATALVLNQYNTYGSQVGGYAANAGGYGGFNENVTYAFTSNNYSNLWPNSYDNLEDYQYLIDHTTGDASKVYFFAAAKILKAHGYQLVVDAYNDAPYSEALKGAEDLVPKYDNAKDIYLAIAGEIDDAIAAINSGLTASVKPDAIKDYDVIFKGDMTSWLQLANTLKLRLMLRAGSTVTFTNTTFDPAGFLAVDALINPKYTRDNNRQNPKWNSFGWGYSGSTANKAWIPTTFVMGFYDGTQLSDPGRGAATFYQFPATGTNQLGFESTGLPKCPDGSFWYPGADRNGKTAGGASGPLKGPDAGFPLLTAAESYFLQAEAIVRGVISGDAKVAFEAGITSSFEYLYKLPDNTSLAGADTDAAAYLADPLNASSKLVNFALTSTTEEKIEAIITQKYIAMNMVNSQEGWNEYRRTGYPSVSGTAATTTFASTVSQSTRADRLPTRIVYPSSELNYNAANVPKGISPFTSTIFWAK